MKEFGGGDLTFLSEDGETLSFVVVGDPELLQGKFKGRPSEKIACPVITLDGFMMFVTGKRLARKISKYEDRFNDTAFMAIRHGVSGDIEASYELQVVSDAALTTKLFEIKDRDFKPEMIADALESAKGVIES
jgi:hypothetical protein